MMKENINNECTLNQAMEMGLTEEEFKLIADLIHKVIKGLSENKPDNSKIENEVKKEIIDLCSSFPIYGN